MRIRSVRWTGQAGPGPQPPPVPCDQLPAYGVLELHPQSSEPAETASHHNQSTLSASGTQDWTS